MLERMLDAHPREAHLHLLLAQTLVAMERRPESRSSVHRAIECGQDDAAVLTRAASMCFYAADLDTARSCVDRAKQVAPRRFVLKQELKELDRNVARRENGLEAEERLSDAFESDPGRPGVAADFARHLARNGQTYAAYHIVARGLHYRPTDRALRRLEKRMHASVPDDVRADAQEWAVSGEPSAIE